MSQAAEPIPYAKAEPTKGWLKRYREDASTRMVAFAILTMVGIAWRALITSVVGNQDLPDGKYLMFGACIGFVFEYVVCFVGA